MEKADLNMDMFMGLRDGDTRFVSRSWCVDDGTA